ncbi:hypothetical protein Tco_0348062 [Tanacetum coccineum]
MPTPWPTIIGCKHKSFAIFQYGKNFSFPEINPPTNLHDARCYRDRSISEQSGIADTVLDVVFVTIPDGDIILFEAILNSDPSPPPPNQGNYFPETRKDLKICKANSSVNEPLEVELKDLPPHLEYAFLEGDDKLPIIIGRSNRYEEKEALIEVAKVPHRSHRLETF